MPLSQSCCSAIATVILWPMVASTQQLPFGDVPPGIVEPMIGCRAATLHKDEREECVLDELRRADEALNQKYDELRKALPRAEASALRTTQREWIKRRDATCGLVTRARSRDRWLADIARTDTQSDCVLQATRQRTTELDLMYGQLRASPLIAEIIPPPHPPRLAQGEATPISEPPDDYLVRSSLTRHSGKFYFEVTVNPELIREKLEASLVVRVSDGHHWIGSTYDIRPRDLKLNLGGGGGITIVGGNFGDLRLPKEVIGVAIDLDAGKLYRRHNGVWQGNAMPGSPNGIALPRTAQFAAELSSSVRLKPLFEKGILVANFGGAPFVGLLPAGYRGFDEPERTAIQGRQLQAPKIFSPGERVAHVTQEQWIRRYWEWVRSFPSGERPSQDTTGFRCGAGQNGPIWFLTGSSESKSIQRECEVPEGKILLVPMANSLAQTTTNSEITCDRLLVSLNQFSAGVTDLRLKVNSISLEQPERFLLATGCFSLPDASSGLNGIAAGTGYWVFIGPLEKGRHELEFGGRFTSHEFVQDIRYVLHVR